MTSGDALLSLNQFLGGRASYAAADVLEYLLQEVAPAEA